MKKILTIIGILSILGGINKAEAQLIPQFSQYMFNGLYINPGYAGYKDVFYGHVIYRKQWVDVDGSPSTALISLDAPIGKGSNLGLVYANDKAGAAYSNSIMVDYAYRLQVGENSRLSLGLGAGVVQHGVNRSELLDEDGGLPPEVQNSKTVWKPGFDAGLYFDTKNFYAGFSVVGLLKHKRSKETAFSVVRTEANYFLTAGVVIPLSNTLKLLPSTLLSSDFSNPLNIDLNAMLLINDKFSIGGGYRTGTRWFSDVENNTKMRDAIALIGEAFITERIRLGFAYDFDLTDLGNGYNGSFEVSLGYYLTKPSKQKYVTPRYF